MEYTNQFFIGTNVTWTYDPPGHLPLLGQMAPEHMAPRTSVTRTYGPPDKCHPDIWPPGTSVTRTKLTLVGAPTHTGIVDDTSEVKQSISDLQYFPEILTQNILPAVHCRSIALEKVQIDH